MCLSVALWTRGSCHVQARCGKYEPNLNLIALNLLLICFKSNILNEERQARCGTC